MLHREIIAVCSQIHTKHINTLYGQEVELFIFKPGGIYSNHWALKVVMLLNQIPGIYFENTMKPFKELCGQFIFQ